MATPEVRRKLDSYVRDNPPCDATGLMAIALALFELADSIRKKNQTKMLMADK